MKEVLEFLRAGASRAIDLPEFKEFWQACSEWERAEFKAQVAS